MDFKTYSENFRIQAKNVGFSESSIVLCLNYAEKLFNNNLPIVYNITHLSNLTLIKKNYIMQAATVSKHSEAYYREFSIPKKKRHETRTIFEPLPNLKNIQYWILRNILYNIPVSPYAKAYKVNVGLKQNLRFHKDQKKVLNLDIENFFPSIKIEVINNVFLQLGYSTTVSKILSKLCALKDTLPQGAPTSPYLSNIVMIPFDEAVSQFCKNLKIHYTRYSDDLSFSGDFDEVQVQSYVEEKLNQLGFNLNDRKRKLMHSSQRQIVTGVVVNEKIQLAKEDRKRLRQIFHYTDKFGFGSHLERQNVSPKIYIDKLLGKINFGLYLNKKDATLLRYKLFLLNYKRENGII